MASPVCVVTGVGPGNGASFCRRFAGAGYRVAMLARSQERLDELESSIPGSRGFAADVGDEAAVRQAFARIRSELGPVELLIHNAGSGGFATWDDTTPEQFETAWRTNALGLLLCGREVTPEMAKAGRGSIIAIGATASRRGGPLTASFASAKAGQRTLAESMARSLWPRGIHVAYLVIDGVIDIPRTRAFFKDKPDDFFLAPSRIADTVHHLVEQDRSAWTFELELRPFGEKW